MEVRALVRFSRSWRRILVVREPVASLSGRQRQTWRCAVPCSVRRSSCWMSRRALGVAQTAEVLNLIAGHDQGWASSSSATWKTYARSGRMSCCDSAGCGILLKSTRTCRRDYGRDQESVSRRFAIGPGQPHAVHCGRCTTRLPRDERMRHKRDRQPGTSSTG